MKSKVRSKPDDLILVTIDHLKDCNNIQDNFKRQIEICSRDIDLILSLGFSVIHSLNIDDMDRSMPLNAVIEGKVKDLSIKFDYVLKHKIYRVTYNECLVSCIECNQYESFIHGVLKCIESELY